MLIRCETNNDWNRFCLPKITSMSELKEYADKNIPIECYMLGGRYKHSIYLVEDFKVVYLYLNNYLQYYKIGGYVLDINELDEIENTVCRSCSNNKELPYKCIYKKECNGCENYQEKFTNKLVKLIKKLK